jgi:single-strand DNA-binding protein
VSGSNANSVTISGNLTRDPELRFLPSGQATTELTVAVNRRWQNASTNVWEETTSFFDVVCWGDLAEHVAQSTARGTRVLVTGRLEQRTWESKGQKRSKIELTADDVALSVRFVTATIAAPTKENAGASPAA